MRVYILINMTFLAISFIAGLLTVLAPCILPLLPVVIGSSASLRSRFTPYIVVGSLSISIIVFTYLLKASTIFIMLPPEIWTYISGTILFLFGVTLLFPNLWEEIPGISKFSIGSNKFLGSGYQKKSFVGDVMIGAALGPIFTSCSPTYFVILASVLPVSFWLGTGYLLAYTFGLALILLFIALLGERFASRLSYLSDPKSKFKRGLGLLFIILGLLIASGFEKKLETAILESGFLDVTKLETRLLQLTESDASRNETIERQYIEIVNPSGFINTNGESIKLGDYVGKQIILLDIMTYSCINCQRSFPYVTSWYEKYKDEGLIVIGIHTPEFAFEKDIDNVTKAMAEFGINFPIILDNEYETWNAYGNRYWPRKYLIDIHGNIVYDHIGEGAYMETEKKIQELLRERALVLGETIPNIDTDELVSESIPTKKVLAFSPETYFGSGRNEYLANGIGGDSGVQTLAFPETFKTDALYLDGIWSFDRESASTKSGGKIGYTYQAKEVYIVASSENGAEIEVWQDGKLVTEEAGSDVSASSIVKVGESRLYKLINNDKAGQHTLELRVKGEAKFFAFTFG